MTVDMQTISTIDNDLEYVDASLVDEEAAGPDDVTESVVSGFQKWSSFDLHRNSCLAHLKLSFLVGVCKRVTEIASFFHTHTKWNDKLLIRTGNVVVLKPVETRWSSTYTALKRFTDQVGKVCNFIDFQNIYFFL